MLLLNFIYKYFKFRLSKLWNAFDYGRCIAEEMEMETEKEIRIWLLLPVICECPDSAFVFFFATAMFSEMHNTLSLVI